MTSTKEGFIQCPNCHGVKIIPNKYLNLFEICKRCNGSGERDWVDHAMDKHGAGDPDLPFKVAYRNIDLLMRLIREEGLKIGVEISVQVQASRQVYDNLNPVFLKEFEEKAFHIDNSYNRCEIKLGR